MDLLQLLVFVFVSTQIVYFLINILTISFIYRQKEQLVEEKTIQNTKFGQYESPDKSTLIDWKEVPLKDQPIINIFIPIYKERPAILSETVDGILQQTYPSSNIQIHIIHEQNDPTIDNIKTELQNKERYINYIDVDRNRLAFDLGGHKFEFSDASLPRTKAVAMKYAFKSEFFQQNEVICVFDSDTLLPEDTFELAVIGLSKHNVVQAKQTVRNFSDGWLPFLESMGIAGWSHTIFGNTAHGPYQLLGKGYFMTVNDLYNVDSWDPDEITEDMALGLKSHQNNYSLGVIDRYVQDLCPTNLRNWLTQKTRWIQGPYPHLFSKRFNSYEWMQFASFTLANQLLSLTNIIGVPAGLIVLIYTLYNTNPVLIPIWVTPLLIVNGITWLYYTIKTYQATNDAITFNSNKQKTLYYLLNNPFTQIIYATLWTIPIILGIYQYITNTNKEFTVTPK